MPAAVRRLPVVLVAVAVLSACASAEEDGDPAVSSPGTAAGGDTTQADDDLQVAVDPGDGSAGIDWTLSCDGTVAGDHPDGAAACTHLAGLDDPFAPLPEDVVCTEQYGGPQRALVTGRWQGEPVELELSRTDGCRIQQWDALVPLLPAPVG